MLVKAWHTDLLFSEFCNKVRDLYGPERKHLLAGTPNLYWIEVYCLPKMFLSEIFWLANMFL